MKFPFTQEEWKEVLTLLYRRAAVDHQFHVLCTRDCHAAIKLICGQDIPKSVGIRFEPQHSDEIVLSLPKENKELFHPLSDHEITLLATGMSQAAVAFSHSMDRSSVTQ